jgi:hypothetical protein
MTSWARVTLAGLPRPALRNAFRLATSNDCTTTGARRVYACAFSVETKRSSSARPSRANHVECFSSGMRPIVRPRAAASAATKSMISSKLRIWNWPSYAVPRIFGRRSTARSVLSSASVKSETNQPSCASPSMVLRVLRAANSGRVATSVVSVMAFSWRATSTPSFVATRSGSTKSAPSAMAFAYAASVCSGRSALAPRCAYSVAFGCRADARAGRTASAVVALRKRRRGKIVCIIRCRPSG